MAREKVALEEAVTHSLSDTSGGHPVGGSWQAGALWGSNAHAPTTTVTCFSLFSRKYCRNCAVQHRDRSLNAYVTPCHSSNTFSPFLNLDRWTTSLWRNLLKARWISSERTVGEGHYYLFPPVISLSLYTYELEVFLSTPG